MTIIFHTTLWDNYLQTFRKEHAEATALMYSNNPDDAARGYNAFAHLEQQACYVRDLLREKAKKERKKERTRIRLEKVGKVLREALFQD